MTVTAHGFRLRAALMGLAVMALGTSVRSQSFSITGSSSYTLTVPPEADVTVALVSNTTADQTIKISLSGGDPSLTVDPSDAVTIRSDSLGNRSGILHIRYVGGNANKVEATITLTDESGKSRSIAIHASDTRFGTGKPPWDVTGFSSASQNPAGYRVLQMIRNGGTVSARLRVENYLTDPISVNISAYGTANLFSVDPTSLDVPGSATTLGSADFTLTCNPSSNAVDTGYLIVTEPKTQISDTIVIAAMDSSTLIEPVIEPDTLFLLNVPASQTTCGDIVLKNSSVSAATITDINWVVTGSFTHDDVSFPLTLGAGESKTVHVCYTAPDQPGSINAAEMDITYHGPLGRTLNSYPVAIGTSIPCVTFPSQYLTIGYFSFESTIVGGYTDAALPLTNNLDHAITLQSITFDAGKPHFAIDPSSLPLTIAAGATATFSARYTPSGGRDAIDGESALLHFSDTGDSLCDQIWAKFLGRGLQPNDTDLVFDLFPSQKSALPITSSTDKVTRTFHFVNNSGAALKVISVTVKDGTHFRIVSTEPATLPTTLSVGAALNVNVEFDAGASGFYTDQLEIVTDHALTTLSFDLQAIRSGVAAVSGAAVDIPTVILSPNPATREARIELSGLSQGKTEVYDLLGNIVATSNSAQSWVWPLSDRSGARVSAGTYFVRVSGTDLHGHTFVATKQLIVAE